MIDVEDRLRSLRSDHDGRPPGHDLADRVARRIDHRAAIARRQRRSLTAGTLVVVIAVLVAALGLRGSSDRATTTAATPRTGSSGWSRIADGPLTPRSSADAVSMGGRVLVVNGYDEGRTRGDGHLVETDAPGAAIYDPQEGTWSEAAEPPAAMRYATLVWSGELVYAMDQLERLYSYDPAIDRWATLAPMPAEHGGERQLLWTGDGLIALVPMARQHAIQLATYDPDSDTWTDGPDLTGYDPASMSARWTGKEVLVLWVGYGSGNTVPSVRGLLRFSPGAGWSEVPAPPIELAETRSLGFTVWTGTEYVVGGGTAWTPEELVHAGALGQLDRPLTDEERASVGGHRTDDAAAYDPRTGTWRALPPAPIETAAPGFDHLNGFWTGREVLVFGAEDANGLGPATTGEIGLLDPETMTWRTMPPSSIGFLQAAQPVWTGHELFLFGGEPTTEDHTPSSCCQPSSIGLTFTP